MTEHQMRKIKREINAILKKHKYIKRLATTWFKDYTVTVSPQLKYCISTYAGKIEVHIDMCLVKCIHSLEENNFVYKTFEKAYAEKLKIQKEIDDLLIKYNAKR